MSKLLNCWWVVFLCFLSAIFFAAYAKFKLYASQPDFGGIAGWAAIVAAVVVMFTVLSFVVYFTWPLSKNGKR